MRNFQQWFVFALFLAGATLPIRAAQQELPLARVAASSGLSYSWLAAERAVSLTGPGIVIVIRPGMNLYEVDDLGAVDGCRRLRGVRRAGQHPAAGPHRDPGVADVGHHRRRALEMGPAAVVKEVTGGHGADIVYDPVGGRYAEPAVRSLASQGRYLVVGFAAGEIGQSPHSPDMFSVPDFNSTTILPWRKNVAWVAGNVYVNGDWSGGGTWGKASTPCTVYINGNVKLSGNATLTNYCTTTVVTGDWTMSGSVQYAIAPASPTHALFVLGPDGATFNGTTNTAGFVYSANGPITINGAGNGSFTGVLYSPYNITMNGGGNSSFTYDQVQSQVKAPNPNVVPIAQWEY